MIAKSFPLAAGALLFVTFSTGRAGATPRPLPFTYNTETLAEGDFEIEQYGDVTPVRALSTSSGARTDYAQFQFQTEFEYGLARRLELGLYFVYAPSPGDRLTSTAPYTESTGMKQRLRYTLANPGEWPIDVGFYGELVENDHEVEIEGKVLLQRRFGKLRVMSNLWAEYEFYYAPQRDLVLNPTLGASYEFSRVHLGAESWMRVEFPDPAPHPRPYSVGPVAYVGPTMLINFGRLWWTTGIYARVSDVRHSLQAGEPYGPIWARTIVGFGL